MPNELWKCIPHYLLFPMIAADCYWRTTGELTERLRNKGYRPEAIRRVFLMADGVKGKVRYFGLPSGYEFSVLLGSLVDVSKAEADLTEDTIQVLNALDKDLHFQVFVTPT